MVMIPGSPDEIGFGKSRIFLTAYSSTGKLRNGKCDTSFAVRVTVNDKEREWIVPLLDATMNQAALLGLKFGILAIIEAYRQDIKIVTDNPYVFGSFAMVDGKWKTKAESNKELLEEVRKMFSACKGTEVSYEPSDANLTRLRDTIKKLGRERLAKA
jgi:ribonuclease HI